MENNLTRYIEILFFENNKATQPMKRGFSFLRCANSADEKNYKLKFSVVALVVTAPSVFTQILSDIKAFSCSD